MESITNQNIPNKAHEQWTAEGFVKLEGFLTPHELRQLQGWVDEIGSWPADPERWMHHSEQTDRGVCLARTENFATHHDGMRELLTKGRIVEVASQLLGQPAVLYKEKINYKYPGGGGYAAHQDAPAYAFIKNHITCSLAVDPATPENGCLFFVSGLHKTGLLPLDAVGCIDPKFAETLTWEAAPLAGGDALFFSSYAPHRSPPNLTNQPRRTLYLTYNALSEGDLREEYYADKRRGLAAAADRADAESPRISMIGHFRGKAVRL